ncbi:hypothetical protein ACFL04_01910 [Patescibacteria group bacterium]
MNPEYPNNMRDSAQNGDMRVMKVCPSCQTPYYPWQAQVLDEKHDAHLLYVSCHKCGSGQVALVLTGAVGVSSVGLLTDLTSNDVMKFKTGDYVTVDDVLEIHNFLEDVTVSSLISSY